MVVKFYSTLYLFNIACALVFYLFLAIKKWMNVLFLLKNLNTVYDVGKIAYDIIFIHRQ